jgi:acetyltransferase-like isoleucine patch superfamily enzyme
LFGRIRGVIEQLRESYEKRKYSPTTVAEYLRRQGAQIGEGCFIVPRSLGTEPYLVRIGNHVAIARGALFITHDGATWIFRDEASPNLQSYGPIVIEDNCVIGANAVLFPNIRIGANSIVGAGSVVISDVPPNTIVMGVPARPFGSIEKYKEKCFERWKAQRPPDIILEPGETWWTSRHWHDNRRKLRLHLTELFRDQLR